MSGQDDTPGNEAQLWEDVHASMRIENSVEQVEQQPSLSNATAVERGMRTYPSGLTEEYHRVEFDDRRR